MSSRLLSFAAVLMMAAAMATQAPSTALAQALCWWCPPAAEKLVEERPYLKKQPKEVKAGIAQIIKNYREAGAPESDVKLFLDALDIEYQRRGDLFDGWLIRPAYAGPEAVCAIPGLGQAACAALAEAARRAALSIARRVVQSEALKAVMAMASSQAAALQECLKAAGGSSTEWTNFCTASRWFAPVNNTRSARCHSQQNASATGKKNFCYNEFGN